MLDFETYKVEIGGSFDFIKLVTRGRYANQKSKQMPKTTVFSLGPHPHGSYGGLQVGKNLQILIF